MISTPPDSLSHQHEDAERDSTSHFEDESVRRLSALSDRLKLLEQLDERLTQLKSKRRNRDSLSTLQATPQASEGYDPLLSSLATTYVRSDPVLDPHSTALLNPALAVQPLRELIRSELSVVISSSREGPPEIIKYNGTKAEATVKQGQSEHFGDLDESEVQHTASPITAPKSPPRMAWGHEEVGNAPRDDRQDSAAPGHSDSDAHHQDINPAATLTHASPQSRSRLSFLTTSSIFGKLAPDDPCLAVESRRATRRGHGAAAAAAVAAVASPPTKWRKCDQSFR